MQWLFLSIIQGIVTSRLRIQVSEWKKWCRDFIDTHRLCLRFVMSRESIGTSATHYLHETAACSRSIKYEANNIQEASILVRGIKKVNNCFKLWNCNILYNFMISFSIPRIMIANIFEMNIFEYWMWIYLKFISLIAINITNIQYFGGRILVIYNANYIKVPICIKFII